MAGRTLSPVTGAAEVLDSARSWRTVEAMHCGGCGTAIELGSGERIGFRDVCPRCDGDLHACRNCAHHDPGAYNECREPNAERVSDRERANRCEWFAPRTDVSGTQRDPKAGAKSALDALFKPRKS
jgi:hypothetical protein